jgi:hypothetical protein
LKGKTKKLFFIFVVLILLISIIQFTKAEELLDSYPTTNGSNNIQFSPIASICVGQVFNVSSYYNLTKVSFYLVKSGSPVGNFDIRLYEFPFYPSFINPITSPQAVSNVVSASTISSSLTLYNFTFSGGYLLKNSTSYCLVTHIINYTTWDTTNRLNVRIDDSSPTHYGFYVEEQSSTQTRCLTSYDTIFYVYGEPIEYETFSFDGNATINDVLQNQTFYSDSEELLYGNLTISGEYTENDLESNFLLGGIFIFIMLSLIIIVLITEKKKKR